MAPSFVLASFGGSTYSSIASSLAAASLDGHVEHPAIHLNLETMADYGTGN